MPFVLVQGRGAILSQSQRVHPVAYASRSLNQALFGQLHFSELGVTVYSDHSAVLKAFRKTRQMVDTSVRIGNQ